ncbi:hypothetical protein A2738_00295 [Candidatus Nomurabacteria bacterium RIFCSPHIGHO2_01_FULL_42_15]|uniref:Uncharacterized protein n=1 Tax=Candidatus Nomurabacteria bacterium RIFCSPHIGHO2_01_FULL_42_15 TaxID=1801742 RepID=A0A1F6VGN0_9BACT|nr:MAG: hypothetical protein A2738_00295 [Candidatus Nomurabacteria bacterium RIFCSPHIGHO2_01_FULL_42_15]OGI92902.1 MAG: hypothetical protein A3A99_02555 [Candidatus Nomurabacteria bacterium RIFCSPLOWO2_01_FULL_41_18]
MKLKQKLGSQLVKRPNYGAQLMRTQYSQTRAPTAMIAIIHTTVGIIVSQTSMILFHSQELIIILLLRV